MYVCIYTYICIICVCVYNYVCEFLPTVVLMLIFALSKGAIMF